MPLDSTTTQGLPMSMTPRTSTPQMPFEFGVPIDPAFRKILQSRIRTLLQAKTEGFPGSYPVHFEPSHLQLLANEEYFVTEKVAGVRYMLLSTQTPKGPACFLIDRHYEISFVPHLLLPLRDNPTKYQNETLLDGEMVSENDGNKKILRFLVFDLMALNGTVVTQRSYSTRLGMMDQDILAVQSSKTTEVRSKEPFTIERKTMQRSYGLNIILSGSKRHKHGGEGLIFVPVRQPYAPGPSPKLLKWKSHTTAQFQIKVTLSKERKPLYCIHVKHGTMGSKFYDYVTPEPALALEWHSSSPDGKIAEFWWDGQWATQMFEKGYGLETRTGGWRFYRAREDKKDMDDENTVLSLVKELEMTVTKQQLEAQIDHIRTQWKAREAGTSSNGNTAQATPSTQRPPVRQLSISSGHSDIQPPLMTPSLNSHYLQSPSVASHSGSLGYFSRKDRERKSSIDDYGSSGSLPAATSGTFSHPLPPKPPPFQPRQSSMDQPQSQSAASGSNSVKISDPERMGSPSSTTSSTASVSQTPERKSTPPPPTTPTATTAAISASSSATTSSASLASMALVKNPLKLSQVPAHLQPIKSWMTVSPVPRAPPLEKTVKGTRGERRDSRDSVSSDQSPRSSTASRKSSMSVNEAAKEMPTSISKTAGDAIGTGESASVAISSAPSSAQENQPQTPTPAHTPIPAGMSRTNVAPALPPTLSFPPTSIGLPNSTPRSAEYRVNDEQRELNSSVSQDGSATTSSPTFTPGTAALKSRVEGDNDSVAPAPVLGKRLVGPSSLAGEHSEDSLAQRRKLSDGMQPSPKMEHAMTGAFSLILSQSSTSTVNSPRSVQGSNAKLSPLLSPLSSPGAIAIGLDDKQPSPRPSHFSGSRTISSSKLLHEVTGDEDPPAGEAGGASVKEEPYTINPEPTATSDFQAMVEDQTSAVVVGQDVYMNDGSCVGSAVMTGPLPTPALKLVEQMAYQPSSDQEKAMAMAKARAEAISRIEKQREEQETKDKKMREDVDRFKEKSLLRKEKAHKRKLQEATEAPVQDRRAQPVRQINQLQGRLGNSDSPVLRGHSQGAQRQVSSPQDQQRLGYSTRQSKAASRAETQQSTQNSPKVQSRTESFPDSSKEQAQPSTDMTLQVPPQRGPRATASSPNSPRQGPSDQQAPGIPSQMLLQPGEPTRQHRRINSMDHHLNMTQSLNSMRPESETPEHRELAGRYGQPYSKRLDVGQHLELNHRRSHSDVGILYKPVVTAIAQPQATPRGPPQTQPHPQSQPAGARDAPGLQQSLPLARPDMDHRQSPYPTPAQVSSAPAAFHTDADSPRMRNNNPFATVMREAAPVKRESKARLQFILNDEDSGPENGSEDGAQERRSSPEPSHWHQRASGQEMPPRLNAAPAEYGRRSPFSHEYGMHEQGMQPHSARPGSVVEANAARRQPSKKQKLSQDMAGLEQQFGSRADEYEYHMRQSQMQSLPQRSIAQPQPPQRTAPPVDRWPQQGYPQHAQAPPPMPGQSHGTANHVPPHAAGRRALGEPQAPPPPQQQQQMSHPPGRPVYQGAEQSLHGNAISRAVHLEPYPGSVPVTVQDGLRPVLDRPTHSRHSSLSKPAIPLDQGHPQGPPYQGPRAKASQAHIPADPYARGYPQPPTAQSSGPTRAVSQVLQQQQHQPQQAPPQYHPQQQHQHQQQQPQQAVLRKKAPVEHHPSGYGPPPNSSAHAGYETRPGHPQNMHPHQHQALQQQQQQQHAHLSRHPEHELVHEVESLPGYHKQSQAPSQFRGAHHEQGPALGAPGYYEQESHGNSPAAFGSSRSSGYGSSQSLHPSSAQERQAPPYPPFHGAGGVRSGSGNELASTDEHLRGGPGPGPGGRGSMTHFPPEHPSTHSSQRQQQQQLQQPPHVQHAPPLQQHPSQQQHDYRHGSASFHHQQQQQQQYAPHQKMIHVQDHPQYPPGPPHHNAPAKVPSPRHGQPVAGHPGENDPNYRPSMPHGQQGHGHGHGHGGPSW